MADLVGKTIGDYQIIESIDDGSRALVYKGFQPSTNRYVAIKVLKPAQSQDQVTVQAFNQYAQLAASLQHPNILAVLDSGSENGSIYLVTPYMDNRSVADQRSLYTDPRQALGLIQGIVPGLQAIYNQGYVHGNLRPTNILLDPQGRPLLADFAIAFRQGETPTAYNSPEQVQGGVVDQRTDVYALGVLLYTLLAGQEPPPGTVANLQAARPDLPQSVAQVILKATAQNPDQRFQKPAELQNALASALQPAPTQAPAATPVQTQAPAQKGTNWMAIALGALLVVALCLCVALVGPRVMEYLNPQATQPVSVQPIEPPEEQPVEPPPEQPPEQQPPEQQPPEQQPPEQQLPEAQPPEQPPADQPPAPEGPDTGDEGGGTQGLQVCNSLGLAGGLVLMGGALGVRRRKRS